MPPKSFSASQLREAAACPRIFYFNQQRHPRRVHATLLWDPDPAATTTACGKLFHQAVEAFNEAAAHAPEVIRLITEHQDQEALLRGLLGRAYGSHVDHQALFQRTGEQQEGLMSALRTYFAELADIIAHARSGGMSPAEIVQHLFRDNRRSLAASFPVGPGGEAVQVRGRLDYIFFDFRTARRRIIDYKLTSGHRSSRDQLQVAVYALLHNAQHGTQPDAGVLYLHPRREMVELSWEQVAAHRPQVLSLIGSMRAWTEYDERTGVGLKPPGDRLYCDVCPWNQECERRLGDKGTGERLQVPESRAGACPPPEPDLAAVLTSESGAGARPPPEPATDSMLSEGDLWLGSLIDREARSAAVIEGDGPVGLPPGALPTHLAVFGAAGSGKTWLAKVLAEEAIGAGVPVVAVDPQGDLVQLLRRHPAHEWHGGAPVPEAAQRRYERYDALVEPRILTPGTSHGQRICLNPLRLPREEDLRAIEDPAKRTEEQERLLGGVAASLVALAQCGGETDSQQTFLYQILQRLVRRGGAASIGLRDIVGVLGEPESVGLDEPERYVRRTERERLARKLNNLLDGPAAGLFSGGQPLDLDWLREPLTKGKFPLNIICLNALTDDHQKHWFLASLAGEIYRWMVTSGSARGGPRLLFYLDEARDFLPAGGRKPPAKEPLLRLFAQGRKYGVACLLCTQSPRSVDYNAFSNCSTKLVGRLESAQDVERVAEWFGNQGKPAWLDGRKGAAAGTFVGRWPGMPATLEGRTFRSRPLYSLHEGAWSPERIEHEMRGEGPRGAQQETR